MASEKTVLIKWVGGKDDQKFTSGIPTDWIKGIDQAATQFHVGKKVVVEWRNPKKKPAGGYPCYDGVVMATGSKYLLNGHIIN